MPAGPRGTLRLAVGYAAGGSAPHGVLVFLTGGPGQPGVPFLNRIRSRLGAEIQGYRLVMLDQRGTGAGALHCPALQKAAGSSDLVDAATGRRAGVRRLDRVGAAFLHHGGDGGGPGLVAGGAATLRGSRSMASPTGRSWPSATRWPTRNTPRGWCSTRSSPNRDPTLCTLPRCGKPDRCCGRCAPSSTAALTRRGTWPRSCAPATTGRQLLNALVAESVAFPSYEGVPQALHAAAHGNPRASTSCSPACAAARPLPPTRSARGFTRAACASSLRPRGTPRRARPDGEP